MIQVHLYSLCDHLQDRLLAHVISTFAELHINTQENVLNSVFISIYSKTNLPQGLKCSYF